MGVGVEMSLGCDELFLENCRDVETVVSSYLVLGQGGTALRQVMIRMRYLYEIKGVLNYLWAQTLIASLCNYDYLSMEDLMIIK